MANVINKTGFKQLISVLYRFYLYKSVNLSFLSKMDPKFDTKQLKEGGFPSFIIFAYRTVWFLSFWSPFIVPFLSSFDKSITTTRSKR